MQWHIEKGIRCDLLAYAAINLAGKKTAIRIFPGANVRGNVATADLKSMVIRASCGIRLVLISEPGPDWQSHPWRCVRVLEHRSVPSAHKNGLPGVRIPDLDLLDEPDAKRTETDRHVSYSNVASFEDGTEWTFGRVGELKGKVAMIRVERDRVADTSAQSEAESFARALVTRVADRDREDARRLLPDLLATLRQTLVIQGVQDVDARLRRLSEWADSVL